MQANNETYMIYALRTEQLSGPDGVIATTFEYDGIQRLVKVTDTEGNATTSVYDMGDRRTEVVHPASGKTTFTYDALGNVLTKQTAELAKGDKVIAYDYDYHRLASISYPDHPENNVRYYYGGRNASHNRKGRLELIEDGTGATEYYYGRMGEVTKTRRTLIVPNQAIATYVTQWSYDSQNRLLEMIYPDEEKVSYSYDNGGQLVKVSGYKSYGYDYVSEIGYDKFGQRTYLKYGNGTETTYTYDKLRTRLENLNVSAGGNAIMDNTYTYDAVGNVLGVSNGAKLPETGRVGGNMQHRYEYDALYRLTGATGSYAGSEGKSASYTLKMTYDNMYRVTGKSQHLSQTGVQFDGTLSAGYDLKYTYSGEEGKRFQLAGVDDVNYSAETVTEESKVVNAHAYEYDANGNLVFVNTSRTKKDGQTTPNAGERKLKWDEENRLTASDDNGFVTSYWYDASGERTVKSSGENAAMFVNAEFAGGMTNTAKFSLYVSPYLVANQGGRYTKHIYIGSQRIVSKLGDLKSYGADPRRIEYAGSESDGPKVDYKAKYAQQQQVIKDNFAHFDVPYNGADNNDYVDGKGFSERDGSLKSAMLKAASLKDNFQQGDSYEQYQYFYHPDHLGSSSFITNTEGEVVQHIEYVPYGEVFIEERNNVWNTPYLFNAKEFDEETGLYYYGARYYDSKLSMWYGVDALAEKYPNMGGYVYCVGNPVRFVDPDGREPDDNNQNLRYVIFGIKHPIAARRIGFGVTKGATNISTNATRFATRGEILYGSRREQEDRGSENGAFRHTLWQATITSEFDSDIAEQAGNAHEINPSADLSITTFTDLDKADETVDLLNNIIGREIGDKNKESDMLKLANCVLDEFHDNGLYTATQDDNGVWHITKTQLSNEKYTKLKGIFQNLNRNGRTQEEQKVINSRAKQIRGIRTELLKGPKY